MTINDRGHIHDLLCNWPEKDVKVFIDFLYLNMGQPLHFQYYFTATLIAS